MTDTAQGQTWKGTFGREYTDRTTRSIEEMDNMYIEMLGFTRVDMNKKYFGHLDPSARILEVGANIGLQLALLHEQGFTNLYGIELQPYAVEKCHTLFPHLNVIQGSGDEIPFKDGHFDMVFTSGVLIHIPPVQLENVIHEMVRCSNRWIHGYEYYADTFQTVNYRGHEELLWKGDFSQRFIDLHPELSLAKKEILPRKDIDATDAAYLLEKGQG